MIDRYYYLVASLPHPEFGKPTPLGVDEFLELCRREMPLETWQIVRDAHLFQPDPEVEVPGIMREWQAGELRLRQALARRRASRLKRNSPPPALEDSPAESWAEVENLADTVVALDSPWDAEEALDQYRWRRLEAWETYHYFDLARLIIYHLKLQLLERRAAFAADRGRACADAITDEARQASETAVRHEFGLAL